MNSKISLLILFTFFIFSCSKKEEELNSPIINLPVNNSPPDSIATFICDSTYSIQSVLYFTTLPNQLGCEKNPTPWDSVAKFRIDIDGDSISDFEYFAQHYSGSWCSPHCVCWDYVIYVRGLDSINQISCIMPHGQIAIFYDSMMSVSDSGKWQQNVSILKNVDPSPINTYFTETYIGIRKNNNYGWMLISPYGLNGIRVKEYAFNFTPGNFIKAGQTQ